MNSNTGIIQNQKSFDATRMAVRHYNQIRFVSRACLIFAILTLSSCERGLLTYETRVYGKVFDSERNDSLAISNAEVRIAWIEQDGVVLRFHDIESVKTDMSGYFDIFANAPNEDLIIYVANANKYFPTDKGSFSYGNVESGANMEYNLFISPVSWIRISYEQLDPTHSISVEPPERSGSIFYHECVSDTTFVLRTLGNYWQQLNVFYSTSGVVTSQSTHGITTGRHDTAEVTIAY